VALYNELQVGRFNAVLHKLLNMKDNAPAPQLAGDVAAVLVLENDRPEWAFLAGEMLCAATTQSGPVAAQISQCQIFNPANSSVLLVLEKIFFFVIGANQSVVTINRTQTLAAASGAGSARDFRYGIGGVSNARITGVTPAGASTTVFAQLTQPLLTTSVWDVPLIIAPGNGVNVNVGTVNMGLACTFIWRERVLELSERR